MPHTALTHSFTLRFISLSNCLLRPWLVAAIRLCPLTGPYLEGRGRGLNFSTLPVFQDWTIPVVLLATVMATNATFLSNSICFLTYFTSVLRKQFAANETFLGGVNSYKRAPVLFKLTVTVTEK